MSLPYLGNTPWPALTREERLFCAELYFAARGREQQFVETLMGIDSITARGLQLDAGLPWSIEYEVCFYRDLLYSVGKSVRSSRFSDKRTFDLCLFSPTDIVIIEAKAQGPFDPQQDLSFAEDKQGVLDVIAEAGYDNTELRVVVLGLASSRYFDNVVKFGKERAVPAVFDGTVSWKQLHESFDARELFLRADSVYKN